MSILNCENCRHPASQGCEISNLGDCSHHCWSRSLNEHFLTHVPLFFLLREVSTDSATAACVSLCKAVSDVI